jgi:hypothetical protein
MHVYHKSDAVLFSVYPVRCHTVSVCPTPRDPLIKAVFAWLFFWKVTLCYLPFYGEMLETEQLPCSLWNFSFICLLKNVISIYYLYRGGCCDISRCAYKVPWVDLSLPIILPHPPPLLLKTMSAGFIILFLYKCIKSVSHMYLYFYLCQAQDFLFYLIHYPSFISLFIYCSNYLTVLQPYSLSFWHIPIYFLEQ